MDRGLLKTTVLPWLPTILRMRATLSEIGLLTLKPRMIHSKITRVLQTRNYEIEGKMVKYQNVVYCLEKELYTILGKADDQQNRNQRTSLFLVSMKQQTKETSHSLSGVLEDYFFESYLGMKVRGL